MCNDPVLKRVAIRKYKDKKIDKAAIEKLVAAFQATPCGMHQAQVMQLVVVEDATLIQKMELATDNAFYGAPVLFVINTKKASPFGQRDASAAAENIMIEASRLNLGSVYVMGGAMQINKSTELLDALSVPKDFETTVVVPVGYAAEMVQEDRDNRYKVIFK